MGNTYQVTDADKVIATDNPADRHARVVGILKDRLAVVERQTPEPWGIYLCKDGAWEIDRPGEVIANRMPWNHNADQSQANGRALHAQRTERPAELQALIEIAEFVEAGLGAEPWAAKAIFEQMLISIESAVAENPGHPQPEGGE